MKSSKQTAALALTGAVALASGAYALGSQSGGGDAVAAKTSGTTQTASPPPGEPGHWHRGGPPNLDGLAARLGVPAATLRSAIEAIRGQQPEPDHRHGDLPQELADALKIDVAKVTAALDKVRPNVERNGDRGHAERHEHGPAPAALAKALGVTQVQLKAAFDKLKTAHEKEFTQRRDEFAGALASRLKLDVAKVKAALGAFERGERHHP